MNQLTIEHISPYLPHGLQLYGASDIWVMHSLGIEEICMANGLHTQTFSFDDCLTDYSPLLRPLSDLTKEINHRGETFVPIICMTSSLQRQVDLFNMPNVLDMKVGDYNKLNSWLFDTQNLIESGLAISVHDLEFNPYEK